MVALLIALLYIAAIAAEAYCRVNRNKAVKGSHQRYILSTWRLIAGYTAVLAALTNIIIGFTANQPKIGYSYVFAFTVSLTVEILLHIKTDEDNWFNGRGKKIWNSIKKTIQSLQPKPVTAIAGAAA